MTSSGEGTDIEDFRYLILRDLNFEAFRVLAREIGEEKAVEVFRPHMRHSGMALVMNAQKFLGLTVSDIESMHLVLAFIGQALWRSPPGRTVLTAKGVEWHNPEGCMIANAPACLRTMVCQDAPSGFFMTDQSYGMSYSCLYRGDPECGTILYNSADPSAEWEDRGSNDTPLPAPSFEKEKIRQFGVLAIGELWLFPTQALVEWTGQAATPKLMEAMRPLGSKWGKELSMITGNRGNDMGAIFSVLDTYNSIMGQEGRTLFASSDRHETEITICPFSVAPGEMGVPCGEAIGAQCEAFCNGICEAVGPDFEVRFTSKMCAGGQNCHRVIRKRLAARVGSDKLS
jgi:hypothetical protein